MGYPLHALLVLLCMSISVEAKVKHYKWEVGHVFWSPDCKEGVMIGINGRFPGPTIRARAGDTIVVELKNRLPTEGVVIHWHGIRQRGTPWADGTASISQCPINPDETFVYRFKVEKAGTHFYHGHYGMQRGGGLYGWLVVDPPEGEMEPLAYDGEHSLLLSDWWHQDLQAQMAGLSYKPFRWVGEPQTLLINGRGQYNCSIAAANYSSVPGCEIKSDHCSPVVLQVEPNKTYRLRIASTTSLASLSLSIESHRMTVVEADGNYVKPFSVKQLEIYSGETYSVLITADRKPASNYWISLAVRGRLPNTLPALGIINYRPASPSKHPFNPPLIPPAWNDYNYSKSFTYRVLARQGTPKPPSNPHRTIVLLNTQTTIDGYIRWSLNNVSLVLPPTPYLGSMKYGLKNAFDARKPSDGFSSTYNVMRPAVNTNSTLGSGVYKLEFNRTVDVVLQNANALAENVSEIHPWHLHGHDFWILGYGDGRFDAERDSKRFNLKNPPLRNSVVVFPYGWAAIRFVADNPGVWAFHCHIEPHLHMGMGVVFAEGVELVGKIPVEAMACGVTGRTLMKSHHP